MKTAIGLSVVVLTFLCLTAVEPCAQTVSPPPGGCYPGFTTAEGCNALNFLTTGAGNTGVGWRSLFSNTTGGFNTGLGAGALALNNGDSNTAAGAAALLLNTSGALNTALGTDAMLHNDTGDSNTAVGAFALFSNTTGFGNTAVGFEALRSATTAGGNIAIGQRALQLATGGGNIAIGGLALQQVTGIQNIAIGGLAGVNIMGGTDNIDIGNSGEAADNQTIRIGNSFNQRTFIAGIRGVTTGNANAINVVIDSDGQLGTMSSAQRFKSEIKPMDETSQAIHALKPVTFHYKSDNSCTPQFGLIAEDVAQVNPHLVVRDENGDIYTVRYEAVNAMLLNEFLKEHHKVEKQEATINELRGDFQILKAQHQKEIQLLMTQLNKQASRIQKLSTQIEIDKTAAQLVVNEP